MPLLRRCLPGLAALIVATVSPGQHDGVNPADRAAAAVPTYLRDVRPILAQHCYRCHGPDASQRKADLRLDLRADAFAERDGVPAFVAGNAKGSEVIARVTSDDPDVVMPPPDAGEPLSAKNIDVLQRWLDGGGAWQEHWSFVPPTRPVPPAVRDIAWPVNDVDRFVLNRLEHEGLAPSGPASRADWLRRVTFDLIGVPPTLDELDAFERDATPDAFATVVDRLLADERYGERQASDWLDLARYADSSGYQRDVPRQAWKWRDWVIAAFNDNMPFDRFTIEQLAGDLLPDATLAQKIATGFNRNHPVNTEAGEELDEYRSAYVIDRVHTTATTWLGLTLACAQCHDHKYDPISQREFYSFYGFFNSIKEKDNGFGRNPKPAIAAPGPDELPRLRDLERRIDTLKKRLDRDDPLADETQAAWEQATRARLAAPLAWTTLLPTEFMAQCGSRLTQQPDGSLLATGPLPVRDTYELVFVPGKRTIEALRLEVLPDPSMPHGASGRADDGRFILNKLTVRVTSVAEARDAPALTFAVAAADLNQERDEDEHYLTAIEPGSIADAIAVEGDDAKPAGMSFGGRGWSVAGDARKEPREAILVPLEPIKTNEQSIVRLTLEHDGSGKFKSQIGRFRVSCTDDARVREQLVPLGASTWHSIGPFPAITADAAMQTAFGPESDLQHPAWRKKHEQPLLPKPEAPAVAGAAKPGDAPVADPAKVAATPAAAPVAAANGADTKVAAAPPPSDPKPADAKPADAKPPVADDDGTPPKPKPKPKQLEWQEQRTWVADRSTPLAIEGPASAWYLSRRLHTTAPRTALLQLRSTAGAKVWLNGALVGEFAPEVAATNQEPKPPAEFDNPFLRRATDERPPRELPIGLRAGDNHLVVKLVGTSPPPPETRPDGGNDAPGDDKPKAPAGERKASLGFTLTLTPEGDDVLDYETLLAVRARADDPATSPPPSEPRPKRPLTPAERRAKVVRAWYRSHVDVAGRVLARELKQLERDKDRFEAKLPSALVMEELAEPRPVHVFKRGDYRNKADAVAIGTPAVLPPLPQDAPKNRLGLAKWLVSADHPLTARVAVNRAWQQFFGNGLVRTPEDFGIRGAPPSHPELLDWLATEFVASGWNTKQLQRTIALSATYRQSGVANKAALERDPDNVLLARGPHQRLSAEMVRDQALAVAGILQQKIGGDSVKPFQPAGLWKATLGANDWKTDDGDAIYRRGLYVYWKRGVPYPSFTAFDAAKRETCCVRRTQTTTPLQALVTLNDPVYVEAGRRLGLRLLDERADDDAARIDRGFRLVTSRAPEPREREILGALLQDLRKHYAADMKAAKATLAVLDKPAKAADAKAGGASGSAATAAGKPVDAANPGVASAAPAAATAAAAAPTTASATPGDDARVAERAAWAQLGATLLNLEGAIRRG